MHSYTATYAGDVAHNASNSANVSVNVITKASTTTSLTVPSTNLFADLKLPIVVRVTGTAPSGQVIVKKGTVEVGRAALANGTATVQAGPLAAGTHTLFAEYEGDAYNKTSKSTNASVRTTARSVATVTLVSTPGSPVLASDAVSFSAYISPVASGGRVVFKNGANVLQDVPQAGGSAVMDARQFAVGTHTITAEFSGNSSLQPTVSTPVVLDVRNRYPSSIVFTTPNRVVAGVATQFQVNAQRQEATGTVRMKSAGVIVGEGSLGAFGQGAVNVVLPTPGIATLTAEYLGDSKVEPSNSAPQMVTVLANEPQPTSTSLVITPAQVEAFEQGLSGGATIATAPATFTITVGGAAAPTGQVVLQINGTRTVGPFDLGADGSVTSFITDQVGTHAVVARYLGDALNSPSSSASVVFRVVPPPAAVIDVLSPKTGTAFIRDDPAAIGESAHYIHARATGKAQTPTWSIGVPLHVSAAGSYTQLSGATGAYTSETRFMGGTGGIDNYNYGDFSYVLSARDRFGTTATSNIAVRNVRMADANPSVRLLLPTHGYINQAITLGADAMSRTAPDQIRRVTFMAKYLLPTQLPFASPLAVREAPPWETSITPAVGSNKYFAVVEDSQGRVTTSGVYQMTAFDPTRPQPMISALAGPVGNSFEAPGNFQVTFTLTAASGTTNVSLSVNGAHYRNTTCNPGATCGFWLRDLPAGRHQLRARAVDGNGLVDSPILTVTGTPSTTGWLPPATLSTWIDWPYPSRTIRQEDQFNIQARATSTSVNLATVHIRTEAGLTLATFDSTAIGNNSTIGVDAQGLRLPVGTHKIIARAWDVNGLMRDSTPTTIIVEPTVTTTWLTPSATTLTAPVTCTLSADVAAPWQLGSAILQVDGVDYKTIPIIAATQNIRLETACPVLKPGSYTIGFVITNYGGQRFTSNTRPMVVTAGAGLTIRLTTTIPAMAEAPVRVPVVGVAESGVEYLDKLAVYLNGELLMDGLMPANTMRHDFTSAVNIGGEGSYPIEVRVTDKAGATASTSGTVNVTEGLLTISSPFNDDVINASSVNVIGKYKTGEGTRIMVNGQEALAAFDRFTFDDLPLNAGTNTIRVDATDRMGVVTTRQINVERGDTTAKKVDVRIINSYGSAPLLVTLQAVNGTATVEKMEVSVSGDREPEYTAIGTEALTVPYLVPGFYAVNITLYHSGGKKEARQLFVVAVDANQRDAVIRASWRNLIDGIRAGNADKAVKSLNDTGLENYKPIIDFMVGRADRAMLIEKLGALEPGVLGEGFARYPLVYQGDVTYVMFVRGPDGGWRIEGM
jgi:Bacterial Ig-like domain (group 3)/Glucodextranase, domain B